MKKRSKPSLIQRDSRLEAISRPGPAAALRRQLNAAKRQPISLARALGDGAYVANLTSKKAAYSIRSDTPSSDSAPPYTLRLHFLLRLYHDLLRFGKGLC